MSHIESGHLPEMNTHVFRPMSNDDALRRCNADLFIDEGFGILPLCPNGKEPLAGSHGVKDAFAEKETVAAVFADGSGLNFGVVPPADMFALDMDIRNGGEASMRALLDAIGPLPTTVTVSTGGGGTHQYFRLPGDVTASQLPGKMRGYSGIDVMTMKRYLVGPGGDVPGSGVGAVAGRRPSSIFA